MNIDFHVHVTPLDIIGNWEKYAEKEPYFALLSKSKHNKFATAKDVAAVLNSQNSGDAVNSSRSVIFEKAVVFGFGFNDLGLCRYVNDYVIEETKNYPEKLIGFMAVSPCKNGALNEIQRCYDLGLKGVGELFPEGQGIELDNKKATMPFTEICRELSLPVLLHSNEPVGHSYPGKSSIPLYKYETFINNNPQLVIILAHWGGGLFFYETMKEIKERFRNVYYDTSASPFLYDEGIYKAAKALGICEKILFGSDFPLLSHSRYFDALEKSGLSCEEKKLILGENAERLLNLLYHKVL